jgi:hypothetical protein
MNVRNLQYEKLSDEIGEAERKAIDSLARYKFAMFGYWAGIWVHLNRIEGKKRPNPFKRLVKQAQLMNDGSVCAENPEFCIGPIVKTDIRQYQCLTCEKRVEDANK